MLGQQGLEAGVLLAQSTQFILLIQPLVTLRQIHTPPSDRPCHRQRPSPSCALRAGRAPSEGPRGPGVPENERRKTSLTPQGEGGGDVHALTDLKLDVIFFNTLLADGRT